ncbi:MAG: hypothetical protein IJC32_04625 [Clostridia bacterium]|nr:hypothetical protein [Clostridia bacterium]
MKSEKYSGTENTQTIEIDIFKIFRSILSKLWLVILVGLIAALGAYYYTSEMVTPTYSSTARVYIQNRQTTQSSTSDLQSATTLKEDFQVIVRSDEVYRQALDSIGEDGANYKSLRGKVSLDNNTTRFVDITVSDPDPVRAKKLADAIAYVSRIRAKEILGVEDVAIEQLGSVSTSPSSPSMSKNIILGAAAGIVLVSCIIGLVSFFDNKLTTVDDIEKYLGITVLGSIPDIKTVPGFAKKIKAAEEESRPKKSKKKKEKNKKTEAAQASEDKSAEKKTKEKKIKNKKDKKKSAESPAEKAETEETPSETATTTSEEVTNE